MDKLRFTLDDLQVQSFATTAPDARTPGTVNAHAAETDQIECPTADPAWETCWGSCYTCDRCGGGPTGECSVDDWCTMYPGNPSGC